MSLSSGNLTQAQVRLYFAVEKEILHSYCKEFLPVPKGAFRQPPSQQSHVFLNTYLKFINLMLNEATTRLMIQNINQPLFNVENEEWFQQFKKSDGELWNTVTNRMKYEFLTSLIPPSPAAGALNEYVMQWLTFSTLQQIAGEVGIEVEAIPERQLLCDLFVMRTRTRKDFIAGQTIVLGFLKTKTINSLLSPVRTLAEKVFGENKKWNNGANALLDKLVEEVDWVREPVSEVFMAHFERHADRIYGPRKK